MSATLVELLGTVGIHGIAADETGMVITALEDTSKKKSNYLTNRLGNRVGRADYDHSIEISLTGKITATSGWSQELGAELAMSNTIAANHLPSGAAVGQTLIDEVSHKRSSEDWEEIAVSAEMLPAFPSS